MPPTISAPAVSTIWYVDAPDVLPSLPGSRPDAAAALALAGQLYPGEDVRSCGSGTLADPAAQVMIGCYPGAVVVSASDFTVARPSQLNTELIRPLALDQTYLIALDAEHGWGAFAQWDRGVLRRAFSATRLNIIEDEGLPQVWERPFWAGELPVADELSALAHALPFNPPALADAANRHWLGFGYLDPAGLNAAAIRVTGFSFQRPDSPVLGDSTAAPATGVLRKWLRRKQHS